MATSNQKRQGTLQARVARARTPERKLRLLAQYAYTGSTDSLKEPCSFRAIGDEVEIAVNTLGSLSPHRCVDRERILSCGAALYRLRIAIRSSGYRPIVRTFPDPTQPDLLALVRMGPRVNADAETTRHFQVMVEQAAAQSGAVSGSIVSEDITAFRAAVLQEGGDLNALSVPEDGDLRGATEWDGTGGDSPILGIMTRRDLTPDHFGAGQALARLILVGAERGIPLSVVSAALADDAVRDDLASRFGGWPQAILVPTGTGAM